MWSYYMIMQVGVQFVAEILDLFHKLVSALFEFGGRNIGSQLPIFQQMRMGPWRRLSQNWGIS